MKWHILTTVLAASGVVLMAFAGPARAAGSPVTTAPQPRYLYSCTISAPQLNFGIYDVFSSTPKTTTTTVTVSCSTILGGGNITVDLSAGQNTGGTFGPRKMSDGVDSLNYHVYYMNDNQGLTGCTANQIVGDGNQGTCEISGDLPSGGGIFGTGQSGAHINLKGSIPPHQNVSPGTYTDTITMTLTF